MSACSLSTTVYEMISIFLLFKKRVFIDLLRLSLRTLSKVCRGQGPRHVPFFHCA